MISLPAIPPEGKRLIELGAPSLHEWMNEYWSKQVKNPDLLSFLPDGLGGLRLANDALGQIETQKAIIASLQHRQRLKAHHAKRTKRPNSVIRHDRLRRWNRKRQEEEKGE